MLSTFQQYFSKLSIIAFSFGVATTNVASHLLTISEVVKLINPSTHLEYEGWILVKIKAFGIVSYDSNPIADYLTWRSGLSRISKIMTIIYTDALPTVEKTIRGDIKDSDVSTLVNQDYQGYLKGNTIDQYTKILSQTFQSQLVSMQQANIPVCLYVGGIRDGKKSTYLNVLKIKAPNKSAIAKLSHSNSFSKDSNNVVSACNVKGEPILERVDR